MIYNDYLELGGERISVEAECAGLRAAGHEVEEFFMSNEELRDAGVIKQTNIIAGDSWRQFIENKVHSAVERFRPEIAHCQNLFPTLGPGVLDGLERCNTPYVRHVRNYRVRCLSGDSWRKSAKCVECQTAAQGWAGVAHGCYRDSRIASLGGLIYARRDSRATGRYRPDAYIFVSKFLSETLAETITPNAPGYVKANSVDVNTLGPGGNRYIFIGRLTPAKGWDVIVQLAKMFPHKNFLIVGDGPDRNGVERASRRFANLEWKPLTSHDVLMKEVATARAVLVPSMWEEPFGRVAAEALSTGTPCLVSQRGGLPEVVDGLPEWLVVPADDLRAWSTAVQMIERLADEEYEMLRLLCFQKALDCFSLAATTRVLGEVYERVLESTDRKTT